MKSASLVCLLCAALNCLVGVEALTVDVMLSNDGPCVKGGRITFKAELFTRDGGKPSGTFSYAWRDNGLSHHEYEEETTNTTAYWVVDYSADIYPVGFYEVQVVVSRRYMFIWEELTSRRAEFEISTLLNGNMSITQHNRSLTTDFVASGADTRMRINLRKGDDFYVGKNSSEVSTYWFVDCKYYGMTQDFSFNYKFAKPDTTHTVEALVIASHEPPTTTTPVPPTTTPSPITTTTHSPNITAANSTKPIAIPLVGTSPVPVTSTVAPSTTTTIAPKNSTAIDNRNGTIVKPINDTGPILGNVTFPFVCLNSSVIPPDPKKTYGYFHREVNVRAPISNITVDGTNWIQPWDMLSLKVACQGSGPFYKCLEFHRGPYNVTGTEKCDEVVRLATCNFSIVHYFLEPSVYTILVILDNEVSTQVYPLTINIYKVSTKPQLSVIVVPVSCSLAAVVLIIFGVAYYIQSRARFTVEVADFDFGQNNPEMEYKTFTERLRDSFNSTVRSGERIYARRPYYGSMNEQHHIPIADRKSIERPLL